MNQRLIDQYLAIQTSVFGTVEEIVTHVRNHPEDHKIFSWNWLLMNRTVPEEFIREFLHYFDWKVISKIPNLSDKFLYDFHDKIIWDLYLLYNDQRSFSPDLIIFLQMKGYMNQELIDLLLYGSEKYIAKEARILISKNSGHLFPWDWLIMNRVISEDFIREFIEYFDWFSISRINYLSDQFLFDYHDKIKWYIYLRRNNPKTFSADLVVFLQIKGYI